MTPYLVRHIHSINPFLFVSSRSLCHVIPEYSPLLERCVGTKSLKYGKTIHQHLLKNSKGTISSILLDKVTCMYISCDRLDLAHRVFDDIPNPSVVIWNLIIRAYAWNGPFEFSIDLYSQMRASCMHPSKYTFPFVLKACSSMNSIGHGKEIHNHIIRLGFESDVYISTALVDLYAKCGALVQAENVFQRMSYRDIVAWNAMIAGFSLHGLYDNVMRLITGMQEAEVSPNSSTIVTILPIVAQVCALSNGKAIHGYSIRRGFSHEVTVGTGLLDMYGKCGCISSARIIFDRLDSRNEVTRSAMVGAYVIAGHMREALALFNYMLLEGTPSLVSHIYALQACTKLIDLTNGRRIHSCILKLGHLSDLMASNSTLSMYAKCGVLDAALRFFHEMKPKDRVSYSAVISGCVQNGESLLALNFFRNMQLSAVAPDEATMLALLPACSHLATLNYGISAHGYCIVRGFVADTSICNALIDMYAKCGNVKTAREVFDRMHKRDIVTWNSMIAGYGIHGLGSISLSLFHKFIAMGMKPDDITFVCLLIACSHSGIVDEGKYWFNAMVHEFCIVPKVDHYICMVDLLSRAGLLDEAKTFIEEMPFTPSVHVWGALLAACKIHNRVELAEETLKRIEDLGPESSGSFVLFSNLLSSAGRWEDAASVRIMQREQGFKKSPGCSWVEINGTIHAFTGGNCSHPQLEHIYDKLEELLVEMKKLGYQAVPAFVFQDVEEEEKEHILLHHSEKLAIAFAILNLSPGEPIFVTKNLRVCGDCHEAIKYITIVAKREIILRDTSRFHHFKDGVCNCGDFW